LRRHVVAVAHDGNSLAFYTAGVCGQSPSLTALGVIRDLIADADAPSVIVVEQAAYPFLKSDGERCAILKWLAHEHGAQLIEWQGRSSDRPAATRAFELFSRYAEPA
jgi:hypothetical protein